MRGKTPSAFIPIDQPRGFFITQKERTIVMLLAFYQGRRASPYSIADS